MRAVGVILLIVGLLLLLVGTTMDVTVATTAGERVYNIGLMNERSNLLTFGGGAFLVGILMATLAGRKASTVSGTPKRDTRPCPYCAESILNEAVKCKHCGSSVEPAAPTPLPYGWAVRIPYTGEAELYAMREVATTAGMPVLDTSDRNMTVGCFEARRDAKAALDYMAIKHGFHGELDFIRMR